MKTEFGGSMYSAATIFTILFISTVLSQVDQTIYYQYCVARPDTVCFEPFEGEVDTVGLDVGALGGTFRFCLTIDTIDSGYAPIRVMLVLDESGSMCGTVWGNCCTAGDGSGYCMQNDPTNKRVEAALAFVDSLRVASPESEVGVINYAKNVSRCLKPLNLQSDGNVNQIHQYIENAGCEDTTLGKTRATQATYPGVALTRALTEIDDDYANIPPYMTRHIVLLTDGAWEDYQDNPPQAIYDEYQNSYPNRELPTVHGVFISNSALHLEHDYPELGCSSNGTIDLQYLQDATTLPPNDGLFFGGSTPQSVVQNFMTLLDSVTRTAPQTLRAFTVTNGTNGASSSNASINQLSSSATWETTISTLPLEYGPNLLTIEQTVYRPGKGDSTITTHVEIYRSDKYRETLDIDLYKKYCELVDASITITASPAEKGINQPFDVKAVLDRDEDFYLDTVEARVFTRFPDSENGVIATFHLDNNLDNASGGGAGTGTPSFTGSEQLFGAGGIDGGAFSYSIPAMSGDFVFEEWVRPSGGTAVLLYDGGGITVGMNAERKLYAKAGDAEIATSLIPLDLSVWSHIGITRKGGQLTIFVNGMAVSRPVTFATPLTAGAFNIHVPNLWVVDEVRISNSAERVTPVSGSATLTIPTVLQTEWVLGDVSTSGDMLSAAPAFWTANGTTLDFTFASPEGGNVLVNLRQKNAGDVGTGWSKNSNPVEVAADLEGPFVALATLNPGPIGEPDILKIDFNEPVDCETLLDNPNPEQAFLISRDNEDNTALLFNAEYVGYDNKDSICTDGYITTISILVSEKIKPSTDSIRIINGAAVDKSGNAAPDNGKKGDIVWGEGAGTEIISIMPEENDPGATTMITDDRVADHLYLTEKEKQGRLMVLTSVRELAIEDSSGGPDGKPSYGFAMIYDAVGNLIASKMPLAASERPDHYYLVWNGRNRGGRRVANGIYLVQFFFKYLEDNKKGNKKVKVAVRW
jgi:hypothetical protein